MTRLGEIPNSFESFILKDVLIKNDSGDWGSEPKGNSSGIIRSTNFTNEGKINLNDVAYRSIDENKLQQLILQENDILIERSGGSDNQPVGRVGFITKEIEKRNFSFANFIQRISVNDSVYPKYVYYCLQQMYEKGVTNSMQYQTTGIRNLDFKLYVKSILPKPPLPEQRKIASILTKVDDAIQAVKNTIEKAERLKKSLMQNLLTGKLKPDGTWRSEDEFYIDEKFGKVPVGWEVKKWGQLIRLEYGRSLNGNKGGEIPVYGTNGQIGYTSRAMCNSEGIIVGRKGAYREIHYSNKPFWVIDTAFYAVPKIDLCILWAYYSLKKIDINRFDSGSAIPSTNKKDVYFNKAIVPPKTEQILISEKITSIEKIIESKQQKIQKLERLKKALMQNLLTGKVRVKV